MTDTSILEEADRYYTERFNRFKYGSHAADWNSVQAQEVRFAQICKVLPDNPKEEFSILDYGCGLGDLMSYLERSKYKFYYYGLDVSNEIIEVAKTNHRRGVFSQGHEIEFTVDYVIASGVFNVRQNTSNEEWHKYIVETITMFDEHAIKGFAFNCLTKYSDVELMKDYLYYADPLELFDYCKRNFSNNVALLHDYGVYDFTIIVRKNI